MTEKKKEWEETHRKLNRIKDFDSVIESKDTIMDSMDEKLQASRELETMKENCWCWAKGGNSKWVRAESMQLLQSRMQALELEKTALMGALDSWKKTDAILSHRGEPNVQVKHLEESRELTHRALAQSSPFPILEKVKMAVEALEEVHKSATNPEYYSKRPLMDIVPEALASLKEIQGVK